MSGTKTGRTARSVQSRSHVEPHTITCPEPTEPTTRRGVPSGSSSKARPPLAGWSGVTLARRKAEKNRPPYAPQQRERRVSLLALRDLEALGRA